MSNDEPECLCIIDTDGLHAIATASGNLKTVLTDMLNVGAIGVPSIALKEFRKLFADEAAELEPFISKKISMKKAFYLGAARIAERTNSGFPRGAHDENVELYVGAISLTSGCTIVTSAAQAAIYGGMGCDASEISSWVALQ
ncbi:hypothetical protein [Bradyrhizobium sp. 6(2017)]|uniref:hypothetical protein n=1 Tax=Bradyrhizobium sp. 6(2017) TaxID=1197460 RepID=UPI002FE67E84